VLTVPGVRHAGAGVRRATARCIAVTPTGTESARAWSLWGQKKKDSGQDNAGLGKQPFS